ncbi:PD-(D/E)XK nuclease family protein [Deltaproteobacteria bacterium]|nr:PD-(D/E)XK nuclease family protein [Deltaproteobacteria bacterium]
MSRDFTLYWTSLERYENCPQSFLWYRGWGAIDCGGGPGKKKPKPYKDSRHHAIMGIVIQGVIERIYNDELWREPQGLANRLSDMVKREFKYQIGKPRNYIDWRLAPSRNEMLKVCLDGTLGFLRTMKHNRFLGEYARSEVDVVGYINKYNPVGGRLDFIIRRESDVLNGISILDGKNSKTKGRYTNPDQLRFYAMCFYLAYGQLPDRLGFVYFRYPYGMAVEGGAEGEVEEGVDWVEFTREDLQGLAQRSVAARKGMNKEKFDPTPTPKGCRWCNYETVCDARKAQKKANARKPRNANDLLEGTDGFVEFGFDVGGSSPTKKA